MHEALEVRPEAMKTVRLLVDTLQALRELDGRVSNQRDRNSEEGREEQRLRVARPGTVGRYKEEGVRRAQVGGHDRPARRPPEGRGGPPRKGRLEARHLVLAQQLLDRRRAALAFLSALGRTCTIALELLADAL